MHCKRRAMEADSLLMAHNLAERVCEAFDCPYYEHLPIPGRSPDHALGTELLNKNFINVYR